MMVQALITGASTGSRGPGDDRILALSGSIAFGVAVAVRIDHSRLHESLTPAKGEERLGEDRLLVRQVDPEGLERLDRVRVHCLGDEDASWFQFSSRELEQREQIVKPDVLDELRAEDRAKRSVSLGAQILERVSLNDIETLRPAALDHIRIAIDSCCPDAALRKKVQELASSTANVDDRLVAGEDGDIGLLSLSDEIL